MNLVYSKIFDLAKEVGGILMIKIDIDKILKMAFYDLDKNDKMFELKDKADRVDIDELLDGLNREE